MPDIWSWTLVAVWTSSSVVQTLCFMCLSQTFAKSTQLLSLTVALWTLLWLSVPVIYAHVKLRGYLEESRAYAIRQVVLKLGFCNALGRLMQLAGAAGTVPALQLSFSHAIIPTSVTFLVTSAPTLNSKFSSWGIVLSGAIFTTCILHGGLLYITGPPSAGSQALFWNTVYLLAAVPFSLSALLQQHALGIRRVNPIDMIVRVARVDVCVQIATLFALCFLRDFRSGGWGPLKFSWTDFSSHWRQESNWQPMLMLLLSCPVAQVAQAMSVRVISFRDSTISIAALPLIAALLIAGSHFFPAEQLLRMTLGEVAWRQLLPADALSALLCIVCNTALCYAAWTFRLTQLSKFYVLKKCGTQAEDAMQLYLPFLDIARRKSVVERLSSSVAEADPFPTSDHHPSIYLPESLPGAQLLTPMPQADQPVLLNQFSGWVLSEFTDYKRHHDFISLPDLDVGGSGSDIADTSRDRYYTDDHLHSLQSRLERMQKEIDNCSVVALYTRRHISLIYGAEAAQVQMQNHHQQATSSSGLCSGA